MHDWAWFHRRRGRMPPPPLSKCVNGWRENCLGKLYLRMLTVTLWMTSIPLMDGAGKRESERPLSCSQCLPSFFLVKDSSLAHDCLFVKNGKGFLSCVFRALKHFRSSLHSRGQAVTARLRERTRREGTGERRQEVPPSPPSFFSFSSFARL